MSAGYSGTPLPKKLGFKEGCTASLIHAPRGFKTLLEPLLPPGVRFVTSGRGSLDIVILFVTSHETLEKEFKPLSEKLQSAGMLWVAWPKKASGVQTDLSENLIREIGLATGLVDVKVCAIDETWSGLKFVIRVKNRAMAK